MDILEHQKMILEINEMGNDVTRSNGESMKKAGQKLRRATHSLLAILQKRSLVKKQVQLDCMVPLPRLANI